jgi:succinate dehydrogenase / fumarate reductase, cytochrome b subunit
MKTNSHWFEPHLRPAGWLAFMLQRLSGIGLIAYLYLHLIFLNQLRHGAPAWDGFVRLMRSPAVLFLDSILLFGILIHGLNGLRLTLIGLGIGLRRQREMFLTSLMLAACLTVLGILAMH